MPSGLKANSNRLESAGRSECIALHNQRESAHGVTRTRQLDSTHRPTTNVPSTSSSFEYRLHQLKKVIYYLAANDTYAAPLRTVSSEQGAATTVPGFLDAAAAAADNEEEEEDNGASEGDSNGGEDEGCSVVKVTDISPASERTTSLLPEAKHTPALSVNTFETEVSNGAIFNNYQPAEEIITVITREAVAAEEIEDRDANRIADLDNVGEPLLGNHVEQLEFGDVYNRSDVINATHLTIVSLSPPSVFLLLTSAIQLGLYYTQNVPVDVTNSQLVYNPCLRQEAWPRYLTYIFAHASGSQLAASIIAQLTLGSVLELVHRWRIVAVYLASALGGCLMHSVLHGEKFALGTGGAVLGLMAARLTNILLNVIEMVCCRRSELRIKTLMYGICGKLVQLAFVLVCCALVIMDALRAFDDPGYSGTQVSYPKHPQHGHDTGVLGHQPGKLELTTGGCGVHIGGLATGALMGILVLPSISDKQIERKLKLACLCLLLLFLLFAIGWNVFYSGFPATDSPVCQLDP